MAEKVVTVSLSLQVANYLAGMEKASEATKKANEEAKKLGEKKQALELLGRTAFVMGSVAAAGIALAIAKAAEFDQAMSNVNAVMQETTENQKLLRQAALDFGASSVFTATEAANAIEELGKAGLSTADILSGALAGALDLASAGQLEIARAAEITAITLQQFGLEGDQAGRVADTLAAGAGKALGSVEDLANGLKFVGPVAKSMGISLEETTGVLALFAQQGIIGEQAGTSLRGMLSSLTSPSKLAKTEMEKLGITLYDAEGGFLGMENAAGELSKAYTGLTDEQRDMSLGVLFGNQQITAARVLYQDGAEGVAEWTAAVEDSGYAAQVARDRLDNLKGDVEQLGGAFDTALITTGTAANDVLRAMVQTLTNVVDLYNAAPEPVKATALAVGVLTAGALLAGGAFLLGAPKVAQFNAALATMGPNAQKAGAALTASAGPIGIAFAVASVALAVFASRQAEAAAQTEAFAGTLEQSTGRITKATRELVVQSLQATPDIWERLLSTSATESVYDSAERLGLSLDTVTEAALGTPEAFSELSRYLLKVADDTEFAQAEADRLGISLNDVRNAADNTSRGIIGQSNSLVEAARVTEQKRLADADAARAANEHTAALDALEGKADSTTGAVDELADTIRGFGSATLDVREATRNLEASYDALTQSIVDNGTTLDIGTDAGRANQSALDDVAKSALEVAAATYERTQSESEAAAVLAAGREELIRNLEQFGITGDAAEAYADDLGLIPENINTAVVLHTAEAKAAIDQFVKDLNNIPGRRDVVINEVIRQTGASRGSVGAAYNANGSVMDFYANGGMRENHVAQIAPAGAWRVWAEPETGGEAYIPFAMSKRSRSLDIWAEAGRRLGAYGFADGGLVQYASQSRGGSLGSSAAAPSFSVVLGTKGGVDLLKYVDVRIEQNDRDQDAVRNQGSRGF